MIRGWRLVKAELASSALDGLGAAKFGGRWNSPGHRMVYLGGTPAIAALEVLAHNARVELLHAKFVLIEVRIPDELVLELDSRSLPDNWRDPENLAPTANIGDRWLKSGASVALKVPAAVLPQESNLLLSPMHPGFEQTERLAPAPFDFDPRLFTR